ncbi:uncharacterized protein LOC110431698 [Sorghum bicolor]|uniref:Uncharacterized protein n=1 Tax=Sorghum bicolor TaxID=4558 RepID=A0A1B6QR11_SORBI|nr:uncharacterized protein LOC110431698 [Sorghum bicolor]KXG40335.1 hypothetical protein SORBI_3001G530400 [Sorghum bicolor]|eukprot:XP_021306753.1 uncharacterized protein LOC110431698 [Sorghum bicolor]
MQGNPFECKSCVFTPRAAMGSSGHALHDANRIHSLGFGSSSKDWDRIRLRKAQLINFLSTLTEQKEKADMIVLDSDDENGNRSGYNKLASEIGKELTTSEVARNITGRVTSNGSQAFVTMHADGDDVRSGGRRADQASDGDPREAGNSAEPKELKAGNEDGRGGVVRPKRAVKPNPKYFGSTWQNR